MKHNFKPYLNEIFIETGTYGGDGVTAALRDGFKRIYSIELSDYYYHIAHNRFHQPNVTIFHGKSVDVLPGLLKRINCPCTFWLDGHYMSDPNTGDPNDPVPLWEELQIIARHKVKTHTILIDDMRLLRNKDAEWKDLKYCICDIEELIHSINPNYIITYDKGYKPKDILIARI